MAAPSDPRAETALSTTPTPVRCTPRSAHRLKGAAAFEAVFRNGRRREGRYVQIITVPAAYPAATPMGRFGFVVSSKVMPRAVDRNRFKRVLRAKLAGMREAAAGFDLVVRVKRRVPPNARTQAMLEAVTLLDEILLARPGSAPQ